MNFQFSNAKKDIIVHKSDEIKRYFQDEIKSLLSQLSEHKVMLEKKDQETEQLNKLVKNQELTINILKGNGSLRHVRYAMNQC